MLPPAAGISRGPEGSGGFGRGPDGVDGETADEATGGCEVDAAEIDVLSGGSEIAGSFLTRAGSEGAGGEGAGGEDNGAESALRTLPIGSSSDATPCAVGPAIIPPGAPAGAMRAPHMLQKRALSVFFAPQA